MNTVKLGCQAKDKITGFEGIVVTCLVCLFGCNQWGIAGQKFGEKDNSRPPTEYFDEGRVEWTGLGIEPSEVIAEKPGADANPDAPRI